MDCELTLVLQARTYNTNQYHPTYALSDTPFMPSINSYMFRQRGAIVRG